jgi:hypothetical protein
MTWKNRGLPGWFMSGRIEQRNCWEFDLIASRKAEAPELAVQSEEGKSPPPSSFRTVKRLRF